MFETIRRTPLRTLCMIAIFLLVAAVRAHAQGGCSSDGSGDCAPEIDASLASSGLALIGGIALLVRGRRKR